MKIHFIGVGGIGVSGLAGFYLSKGHKVSGSDLSDSPIIQALKQQDAKIFIGTHNSKNLSNEVDLVVYTAAVEPDNPELQKAKKLGIKCQTYAQALGDLTKKMFTIAVSGMHGKSTTTAMLALVLEKAGLDPTVIVGTRLREWGNRNFRVGKSKYLVIEADEYNVSFLNYWPKIIVLTNIEEEHLDYYRDLKHIMATFKKYVSRLGKNGVLVANREDNNVRRLLNPKFEAHSRLRRTCSNPMRGTCSNPKQIQNLKFKIQNYFLKQKEAGRLKKILKIPGEHNVSNALAVLMVARELKIPDKITFEALSEFRGTWRRMEYRGMVNDAKIYDDYGHHPTEIRATLQGARELLGSSLLQREVRRDLKSKRFENTKIHPTPPLQKEGERLWCVFQPHQYQRTYKLFDQFVGAFGDADRLILLPIYSVAGREKVGVKKKVSSKMLAKAIVKRNQELGIRKQVLFIDPSLKAENYLKENLKKGDVCVIMGAGDIYKLTEMLFDKHHKNA
ncbi:MAG: UDP-N-acetylmuramate--L-alanine ligase [Candidatus Portnoybacteria bacterium]|nr:UDP-N-acetylmuramate--L-alanine ligase [Candidatus Portnoybacteria bacterium]